MAVAAIAPLSIYLVEHIGGGWILHAGGGYVANTLISAEIVSAFSTATSAIAGMAGTVVAAPAAPVAAGLAALAVVAASGYCYFYGVPVPVESILVKAGLATKAGAVSNAIVPTAAKGALAVPMHTLVPALIICGLAGYTAYKFYENHMDASRWSQTIEGETIEIKADAKSNFEATIWDRLGNTIWGGISDASEQLAKLAVEAANLAGQGAAQASATTADAARSTYGYISSAFEALRRKIWSGTGDEES